MDAYYAAPSEWSETQVRITGPELHHLTHVMRVRAGDSIAVVDGAGMAAHARIETITSSAAACEIIERLPMLGEPARHVTLAAALLKHPGKFDWIVEKAVELGVSRIVPLRTARTIAVADKHGRWKGIAQAAMKQCGRCMAPPVDDPATFDDVLASAGDAVVMLFHQDAPEHQTIESRLASLPADRPIVLCIGPEGGFDGGEVARADGCGADILTLGARRLRSETAAIAALSRIHP